MSATETTSPSMSLPLQLPFLCSHRLRAVTTLSPKAYPTHGVPSNLPLQPLAWRQRGTSALPIKPTPRHLTASLARVKRIKVSPPTDVIQGYLKRDAPTPTASKTSDAAKAYMKTHCPQSHNGIDPYTAYQRESNPHPAMALLAKVPTAVILPPPSSEIPSSHINHKTLPRELIECPTADLIMLVSRLLTLLITINDKHMEKAATSVPSPASPEASPPPVGFTRFHSRSPPNISIHLYLLRLSKYSSIPNSILLTTVYYIDLLSSKFSDFSLNSLTVHRFLLTATTVGCKGLLDSFATNTHYAKVGGVQVDELNLLEMEFLLRVKWDVVPKQTLLEGSHRYADISTAGAVLDVYYRRLIELVGVSDPSEVVYTLNAPEDHRRSIPSPSEGTKAQTIAHGQGPAQDDYRSDSGTDSDY